MRRVVPLPIVLCLGFAPAPLYEPGMSPVLGDWRVIHRTKGSDIPDTPADVVLAISGITAVYSCKGEEHTTWTIECDSRKESIDTVGVGES